MGTLLLILLLELRSDGYMWTGVDGNVPSIEENDIHKRVEGVGLQAARPDALRSRMQVPQQRSCPRGSARQGDDARPGDELQQDRTVPWLLPRTGLQKVFGSHFEVEEDVSVSVLAKTLSNVVRGENIVLDASRSNSDILCALGMLSALLAIQFPPPRSLPSELFTTPTQACGTLEVEARVADMERRSIYTSSLIAYI